MYKKQMILQRIACYLVLGAAALVFIYSLGLVTDMYDSNFSFCANTWKVKGTEIYANIQDFNRSLTGVGLVLIILAVAQFVARNHVRRKYYIANYITVGVNSVAALVSPVWALSNIFDYKEQYLQVDFDRVAEIATEFQFDYTFSTFWFDISLLVFGVLLVALVVNIANLAWKISLMKAEQKLIEEGREE